MSEAQSTAVPDFEPTSPTPTKVYVNGTQVPAADVDVHLRKEGELAISRYAEVDFASPFNGKDFLGAFNSLGDDQTTADTLRIDVRNQRRNEYSTVFNGIVTGLGDSDNSNRKIHHCRAQSPENYLSNIPASKVFRQTTVEEIIGYVVEELNENFPLNISVGGVGDGVEVDQPDGTNPLSLNFLNPFLLHSERIVTNKTFQQNKHTLSDVIDWLQGKVSGRAWVQPSERGGELIVVGDPSNSSQTHRAHYLDGGNLRVINNTALQEIKPLNTIILNGRAKKSLGEVGDFELNIPSETFTTVKARHTELYKRNGEKELSDTIRKSDGESKEEVRREAASILKQRIDEATGGSITVTLSDTLVQPFDLVEARPTVNTESNPVDPITYEVNRCHYRVRPNDHGTVPQIELNAGIHTDISEDIEIVDTWDRDA